MTQPLALAVARNVAIAWQRCPLEELAHLGQVGVLDARPRAAVTTSGLGGGDPFTLALRDLRSLELGERSKHEEEQGSERVGLARAKGHLLGAKADGGVLGVQLLDDGAQLVEVPGEAVERVDGGLITLAHRGDEVTQARTVGACA